MEGATLVELSRTCQETSYIGKNFMEVKKDPDTFNTFGYLLYIESIQLLATVTRRFAS